MSDRVTLTTFTPSEAERITGVSNDLQRNWRRRGHLRSHDGHARFDAFALADMWGLKMLSDRGIGPTDGVQALDSMSTRLVWHALASFHAWEGDVENAPGLEWADKSEWLRRELLQVSPARFFVWLADGRPAFTSSIESLMSRFGSTDPAVAGPLIVFDLEALGSLLLDRAGRALAHFDSDPPE